MVKKLFLILGATFLSILLFTTAITISLINVAGEPEPIKKTLSDSGIYSSVIAGQLDQVKTSVASNVEVSLTTSAVKDAAEKTITPQYLQENVEKIIDSIYAWLKGNTPKPDFRVDLGGAKNSFADILGQAAQTKAASLPLCTGAHSAEFDIFNATCLPKGLSSAQAGTNAKNAILNGEFLNTPVISADSVKSGNTNVSIFEDQLKQVPEAYRAFKSAPIILGILSLLAALAIVLGSTSKRSGIRRTGITLLFVGLALVAIGLTANSQVPKNVLPKISINNNEALSANLRSVIKDVVNKLDNTYILVGGIYAGLGAVAVAGALFIGKGNERPPHERAAATEAAPDDKPKASAAPPPSKPPKNPASKPAPPAKPKTRKIQVQ